MQAAVSGGGRTAAIMVLVPRHGSHEMVQEVIADAVRRTNQTLPHYARLGNWILAVELLSPRNGELTENGRGKRDAVLLRYHQVLSDG